MKHFFESPIGWIALTAEASGLTAITFTDTPEVSEEHPIFALVKQQLEEYFAGKRKAFDLPFCPSGTLFQQKVWAGLCDIPFGETLSYQQLAIRLGDVKAIRAVAAANGKNPLAICVPCHRVIGQDGKPVGYAWDIWRKEWLLHHERRQADIGQMLLF